MIREAEKMKEICKRGYGFAVGNYANETLFVLTATDETDSTLPNIGIRGMHLVENEEGVGLAHSGYIPPKKFREKYFRSPKLLQMVLRYQSAYIFETRMGALRVMLSIMKELEKEKKSEVFINEWIEKNKLRIILN